MRDKKILVSAPCVFRLEGKKSVWFIARQSEDEGWVIPKSVVRKVESSVRGGIRMMGEQGGMTVKVLEEVGRAGGAAKINGKPVAQRFIYYLVHYKGVDEEGALSFLDYAWVELPKAKKMLKTKRDISMLTQAKKLLRTIDVERLADDPPPEPKKEDDKKKM